jgi:intein/homing endonuclease
MASWDYFLHYIFRLSSNNADNLAICCLDEDTLIKTPKGDKSLKELGEGVKEVYSLNFKNKKIEKSLGLIKKSRKQEINEIKTNKGNIINASSKHIFFVLEEGVIKEKRVKELKKGDLLLCS